MPVAAPVRPMLAKAVRELPVGDLLYEPKWDGFRCLVFRRADDVVLQGRGRSRDGELVDLEPDVTQRAVSGNAKARDDAHGQARAA